LIGMTACREKPPADRVRASGYVEATEVRIASEVGGRIVELRVGEGDRINVGDVVARLDSTDAELAVRRARAERKQADAQLRLLAAGNRREDIQQAGAQLDATNAELGGARAELAAAEEDLKRFESLLASNSGSRKQRDDAQTRRDVARERVRAAAERVEAARAGVVRMRAGARPQEIDAARARVEAVDAQIASLEESIRDATVTAPAAGVVTEKLVDAGEVAAPRTPLLVVADLDRAWVNVFIEEPLVPRIKLGQRGSIFTDAGHTVPGTVTFISPRAEFTPRNVQTAEERSKLVYRIKVTVDNRSGVLKQGMPVDAELMFSQ
jgi:HlyD family secretion protein